MFGRIVFVSFVHFQKHKEMTPMKSDTNTLNTEERERERERGKGGGGVVRGTCYTLALGMWRQIINLLEDTKKERKVLKF